MLFKQQEIPEGEVNIKVTGYQWYWGYEYTDHDFAFDSYMIGQPATVGNYVLTDEVEAALVEAGYSRNEFLLATDTAVVVPVNKTVVMTVTAADVIHSWTIPAFGVKQDGVGTFGATLVKAEEGVYFGHVLNYAARTTHTCQSHQSRQRRSLRKLAEGCKRRVCKRTFIRSCIESNPIPKRLSVVGDQFM